MELSLMRDLLPITAHCGGELRLLRAYELCVRLKGFIVIVLYCLQRRADGALTHSNGGNQGGHTAPQLSTKSVTDGLRITEYNVIAWK